MNIFRTSILGISLLSSLTMFCQLGVSSGSLSLIRNNGFSTRNELGNLNDRTIIVEDFMNYHKHQIKIPTEKETALSLDYNNAIVDTSDEFIFQVGLATTTKKFRKDSDKRVNITLVIDRSGSMGGGKLEEVKKAMKKFIDGLDSQDYLSIVSFDNQSFVNLSSSKIGKDRTKIYAIIENIYVGGSTNINDGLMKGFEEVEKHADLNVNSRVILLTDGMTNSGETNSEKIIENSKKYTSKGIEISTIGVGTSLDFDLLRQLSDSGKGSNYFIGESEEDIQKVFVDELESLLFQIGKNPKIEITFPDGFKVKEFYGYNPVYLADNKILLETENLNSGQTQVFIMKVQRATNIKPNIRVELTYEKEGIQKTEIEEVFYDNKKAESNPEIKKNYQIAYMASRLKEAAKEYNKNNIGNMSEIIKNTSSYIYKNADINDPDIKRVYDIIKNIESSVTTHDSYRKL